MPELGAGWVGPPLGEKEKKEKRKRKKREKRKKQEPYAGTWSWVGWIAIRGLHQK